MMSYSDHFNQEVQNSIGPYYVYAYVDPRNQEIFYIGKGTSNRAVQHLFDRSESEKVKRIEQLRSMGLKPRIDIISRNIENEETAYRIEEALISAIGKSKLTNKHSGFRHSTNGRIPLDDIISFITSNYKNMNFEHPCLLIRVNRLFDFGMAPEQIYEITRGVWRVGQSTRELAEYGCTVYEGVIREVFKIHQWHPAMTLEYVTRNPLNDGGNLEGRWEFEGEVASQDIRDLYINASVKDLFKQGNSNPIMKVGF